MRADWPQATGVASISRSSSALPGVASASQRSAASISGARSFSRSLYSLCASSRGNRCPTRRGAARSQYRSSSNRSRTCATAIHTSSASVTSGGPPWPAPAQAPGGDNAVGQLDVECGQEGVQVGDHDGLQGPDVCVNADPGHSSHIRQRPLSHAANRAETPVNDLGRQAEQGRSRRIDSLPPDLPGGHRLSDSQIDGLGADALVPRLKGVPRCDRKAVLHKEPTSALRSASGESYGNGAVDRRSAGRDGDKSIQQ